MSITNTLGVYQKQYVRFLEGSPEVATFFVELLKEHWEEQNITEEKEVAKKLWDMFFLQKKQGLGLFLNFHQYLVSVPPIWITNVLVHLFGHQRLARIARSIHRPLLLTFLMSILLLSISILYSLTKSMIRRSNGLSAEKTQEHWITVVVLFVLLSAIYMLFIFCIIIANCFSHLLSVRDKSTDVRSGYNPLMLWYRSCLILKIGDKLIEQIVGKGMLALLKAGE